MTLNELDRLTYQEILNRYAESHEKATVMDFHHQLKSAILDAYEEGLVTKDPTRRAVIKGKQPTPKKENISTNLNLSYLFESLN